MDSKSIVLNFILKEGTIKQKSCVQLPSCRS